MELSKEYKKEMAKAVRSVNSASVRPVNEHPATQPMKQLKSCIIEAEFPELKGGKVFQVGRGRGTNNKAAAGAAIRNLLKQKGLKAQRYTTCKATISFGTVTVEETR